MTSYPKMVVINPEIYMVKSEMDIAKVVKEATLLAEKVGFKESRQHEIATAASELARNILKYAGDGDVTLGICFKGRFKGIEIIAEDEGPGIKDINQALTEHFSSNGTLGLGLPGVKRIMDEVDIQTEVGKGTAVSARKWIGYGKY